MNTTSFLAFVAFSAVWVVLGATLVLFPEKVRIFYLSRINTKREGYFSKRFEQRLEAPSFPTKTRITGGLILVTGLFLCVVVIRMKFK